jgi:hypothetical protein
MAPLKLFETINIVAIKAIKKIVTLCFFISLANSLLGRFG